MENKQRLQTSTLDFRQLDLIEDEQGTGSLKYLLSNDNSNRKCICKRNSGYKLPLQKKEKKRINERMFNMDGIDWHMVTSSQLLVD